MSEQTKINEDQQKPAEKPAAKPFDIGDVANPGYEIDVPEKLVEKPAEEPAPVAEKKPEPKVEKPKHSRLSVQLGLSLGIPQDMIDEASPAELTTAIAALSARQPEKKPEPKKEEPADEFDLGVDLEQFDEVTQKVLKAQNDALRKLAAKDKEREEREKAREEKLARLEMTEKQREVAAFNDAVDAAFNSLGEHAANIFGNGKVSDGTLDDAQARRRKMIVQSVDLSKCKDVKEAKKLIVAEAALFAGLEPVSSPAPAPAKKAAPPKDPTTGKFVKEPETDDEQEQAIIEKWQRSQLPRPTHRETDDGLTPEQRAANRVKEVLQTAREVQPNGRQNGRETRL